MTTTTYTKYELLRAFRNRRFFIFSLIFPLILYVTVTGANKNQKLDGTPFAVYYLAGMVAWGSMGAVLASGARIALEREVGWHRQLRITPLSVAAYFRAKVITGYGMAAMSIILLYIAGLAYGVSLSAGNWLEMTGLILVGLVPFAIGGIVLGHVVPADAIGPALGGSSALLALLGGAFGPLFKSGPVLQAIKLLPSYWLVQAGASALGRGDWPIEGWLVIAAWSVVLFWLAAFAYRRDAVRS